MQANFIEIKENEYQEFLEWLLDKKVEMCKELDIILAKEYEEPYIYYSKEIKEFFETTPMKRIRKIEQLATNHITDPNVYHLRLEHCKGAYKNALDFWLLRCKDPNYRKKVEKEDRKLDILADIMELARHDDCHTMLSHALESLLCNGKINHEDVGKRILLENAEYKQVLNMIKPGLYEKMCQKAKGENDEFKTLKEGNIDFDRMDYLIRDSLYLGYPRSRKLIEVLNQNCHIEETLVDGQVRQNVIYEGKAIEAIQNFLQFRKQSYKKEFYSPQRNIVDQTLQYFCKKITEDETKYGDFLKRSIRNYQKDIVDEIDLEQFLETEDIKFYNDVIEIARLHPDDNIRELAGMCLPNLTGLIQMAINMLDTQNYIGDYEPSEQQLIDNIKQLKSEDSKLARALRSRKQYESKNITVVPKSKEEYECICHRLREKLDIKNGKELLGIFTWNRTFKTYNKNKPIYVKEDNGEIVSLDQYSKLKIDIEEEQIYGISINPLIMKLEGYTIEQISQVTEILKEIGIETPSERTKDSKLFNASMFKVGHEPYIIGEE